MPTVLPFHRAVTDDPAFTAEPFAVHTRWIETEFAASLPPQEAAAAAPAAPVPAEERLTVEVGGKRLEVVVRPHASTKERTRGPRIARRSAARPRAGDSDELASPMQGTIIKIVAAEGDRVSAGDPVVILEAMKMEQPLSAHKDGTVTGLAVSIGQTVTAGTVIASLKDLGHVTPVLPGGARAR
jgi:acetyl-CoA/propionyl-CoA carboxylase biotin carboxyl carrier protein